MLMSASKASASRVLFVIIVVQWMLSEPRRPLGDALNGTEKGGNPQSVPAEVVLMGHCRPAVDPTQDDPFAFPLTGRPWASLKDVAK